MFDNAKHLSIGPFADRGSADPVIGQANPASRTRHRWTPEDDDYLRASFEITSSGEIARRLGRTRSAVGQRASKVLQLRRRPSRPRGADWEPDATAYLRANYGGMRTKEIADNLRRTASAIHSRACKLGLTRGTVRGPNRPWTPEGEGYVLQNYRKLPTELIAQQLNRTPHAITGRALSPRWGAAARIRSRKIWTSTEDAALQSAYGKCPTQSIGQVLGRTAGSVHSRAHKMGLTRPLTKAPPRVWTGAEDDLLRTAYGQVRPMEIAKKLGRSRASVYHRAEHLGLFSAVGSPEFLRRQSLPRTARPFVGLPNPLDIGYVAGIIDGEGSVLGPPKITVQVSMTTPEVIHRLQDLCGGSVTGPYEQRSGTTEVCKPQYHWTVSSADNAYRLLKALLPYLIVKKEKAEEVIRILEKKWSP